MTVKIRIKAQDLFNALNEEYKFITCDKEDFGYVKAWKFKPTLEKDGWKSSEHTKEELNYMWEENDLVRAGAAAALGVLRDTRALMPLRELIMKAEELGELEDTALKAFKKIMAANWQTMPSADPKKQVAVK